MPAPAMTGRMRGMSRCFPRPLPVSPSAQDRRHPWALALLLCASLLVPARAAQLELQGVALNLSGPLAAGDGERLAQLLSPSVRLLRVQSPGGDLGAALDIAALVKAQQLAVSVDGLCAAECAQFLLPAAAGLSISDDSVIALTSGPHGTYLTALREDKLNAPELQGFRQSMDVLQQRVAAHVQAHGQDTAALDFMLRITSPAAIKATLEPGEGGRPALNMHGARSPLCAAWVLDADTLPLLGVQTSRWEAPNMFQAALRLRVSPTALYRGPPLALQQLQGISRCSALPSAR
jgi:hypothetical protein